MPHAGQYVNAQGQVDPEGRDPSEVGPRRQYPLWDRGDAGYLESCTFAAKNFNGRKAAPAPRDFDYRDADTYSRRTDGQPLPTIESIYALHSQKYFEYVPWRGRMSEFWDSKWSVTQRGFLPFLNLNFGKMASSWSLRASPRRVREFRTQARVGYHAVRVQARQGRQGRSFRI